MPPGLLSRLVTALGVAVGASVFLPWIVAGEVSLAGTGLNGFPAVAREVRAAVGGPVINYWGDLISGAHWLLPLLAAGLTALALRGRSVQGIAVTLGLLAVLAVMNLAVAFGPRVTAGLGLGALLALVAGLALFLAGIGLNPTAFLRFVDRLSMWTGHAFGWCIVILTLGVAYEVVVRYALRAPTTWSYDMSYMMYGALFLMGGAYTLSRNGHVRGDVLYRLWPARVQAGVDLALYVLFLLPAAAALLYSGWIFAARSWRFGEVSIYSPAGVPVYPMKTLIPIAGLLLFLQGMAEILRCWRCIRDGAWPRRFHDVEELETAVLHQQEAGGAAR